METNWIELKSTELNSIDGKFLKLCSIEVGSMETVFVNRETKSKTTSLTEMPGGPLSNKCFARKFVFFERKSIEFDMVDEKSTETNSNNQKAKWTIFIKG